MAKRRSCRRSPEEQAQHDTAVKVRKMTDEQLIRFIEKTAPAFTLTKFLERLEELSGTGNGIGKATVMKLEQLARKEGYLE